MLTCSVWPVPGLFLLFDFPLHVNWDEDRISNETPKSNFEHRWMKLHM